MEDTLSSVYYQTNHLWKGRKAIKELESLTRLKRKFIKSWLSKQALWQVHLPKPKHVNRPHYEVTIPNQVH